MIRPIILARAARYDDHIGIRVAFIDQSGKKSVLMVSENVDGGPMIRLDTVEEAGGQDSFIFRGNELGGSVDAQNLMDSLWDAGIRPAQAKGSAGQMAAVNEHLKDMRQAFWEQHKLILDQSRLLNGISMDEARALMAQAGGKKK